AVFGVQKSFLRTELERTRTELTELAAEGAQKEETPAAAMNATPSFPYQELYPDLYVTPPTQSLRMENTVYLTFDDGPSDVTPGVLDTLRENDVKATFFVVGSALTAEKNQETLRRMAAEGHTIGIHTYTHDYDSIYASIEAYLEDFNRTFQRIHAITGDYPTVFRFPGGSINGYTRPFYQPLIAELSRRGFAYFDWNVSSEDAAGAETAAAITHNTVAGVLDCYRAVVLLHDSGTKGATAEALPGIVTTLRERGYQFAPLTGDVRPVIFNYED
ncbi:MAG: polysaccharide deacetylase family protein, partial [Oscillospiraceae bacterium]